jgi:hypothetical protein
MSLTFENHSVPTPEQSARDLRDHLSALSSGLKELRIQKCLLREQKNTLFALLHSLFDEQQALASEEHLLIREEAATLAQLICLFK